MLGLRTTFWTNVLLFDHEKHFRPNRSQRFVGYLISYLGRYFFVLEICNFLFLLISFVCLFQKIHSTVTARLCGYMTGFSRTARLYDYRSAIPLIYSKNSNLKKFRGKKYVRKTMPHFHFDIWLKVRPSMCIGICKACINSFKKLQIKLILYQ